MGLGQADLAALAARSETPQDGVWPSNVEAVAAFLSVASQWRVSDGRAIGLDYTAVRAGLGALRIRVTPELWRDLQVMEAAATSEMAGRR